MCGIQTDNIKSIFSYKSHLQRSLNLIWNTFVASSILIIGLQIASWCESKTEAGLYRMAGQFSFGRDGDSTVHCPCLLLWPPCQRRTALWFSPWMLPIHLWSLPFLISPESPSLWCNLPFIFLFLCSLCFLPCTVCCHGKYIGPRWATKIWICCCCGYTSKSGQCFQEFYSLSLLLEKKFDARISCSIDDTFCVRDQPSSITNRNWILYKVIPVQTGYHLY